LISGLKRVSGLARQIGLGALAVLLAVSAASPAAAQTARRSKRESTANRKARIAREIAETYGHRFEAAGGGGYLRFRSGQYLQKNSEIAFFGSTLYSLTPKFGIFSEVAGAYGNAKIGDNPYLNNFGKAFAPQISEYTFTTGPSYRLYAKQKFAATIYGTGGMGLGKFDSGSKGFTAAELGMWPSGFNGAFTAGVNLDYNLYQNIALRVTPKFVGTTFGDSFQANKGFNMGVVYRFGKIK
jgi:hypothetical protein